MWVLLVLICFIGTFLNTGVLLGQGTSKREVFICSALIFSVLIAFITEFLSAFHSITFGTLLAAWLIFAILNIWLLFVKRAAAKAFYESIKLRINTVYRQLTRFELFLFYAVAILLVLIFVQGILYPPNNWDSMTYHMARIVSWVSHRSVAPYPSHIYFQVYQPPFAEYVLMNLGILTRSDFFSNTVQFLFFLFSLVTVASVAKILGLNGHFQVITVFLAFSVPEVVLQASSTQNDAVVCFFVLASFYFSLVAIKEPVFTNFLFLGIAAGIAILTKGTAYIYLFPILLVFGIRVLVILFQTKKYTLFWYGLMVILIGICINAGVYIRNYSFSKNILGVTKQEWHDGSNEKMSPVIWLSSMIKNASLHMGIMGTDKIASATNKVVEKFHNVIKVNMNDPANNCPGYNFSAPLGAANHEDAAPNFFHFILITASCILIFIYSFKQKRNVGMLLTIVILFLQAAIFCFYLKWEPWNTRLQLPMFLTAVVLIGYGASINLVFKKIVCNAAIPLILLYAVVLVLHNNTRPYLSLSSKKPYFNTNLPFFDPRYKNYFANRPEFYTEYQQVSNHIEHLRYKNIGLILGVGDWEYPLFTRCFSTEINPIHIFVNNATKDIDTTFKHIDCIASTNANRPFIDYNKERFYNATPKNKYLYFYILR